MRREPARGRAVELFPVVVTWGRQGHLPTCRQPQAVCVGLCVCALVTLPPSGSLCPSSSGTVVADCWLLPQPCPHLHLDLTLDPSGSCGALPLLPMCQSGGQARSLAGHRCLNTHTWNSLRRPAASPVWPPLRSLVFPALPGPVGARKLGVRAG